MTSGEVWEEVKKKNFGVLGMVTSKGESRTVGIVYVVNKRKLYIGASPTQWKTRHVSQNPHISMTVPIGKRVPLMPWIKVPAATITFSGVARVLQRQEIEPALLDKLYRHESGRDDWCAIEVTPEKDFITYGVGIPLLQMRFPEKARARVPVRASGGLRE